MPTIARLNLPSELPSHPREFVLQRLLAPLSIQYDRSDRTLPYRLLVSNAWCGARGADPLLPITWPPSPISLILTSSSERRSVLNHLDITGICEMARRTNINREP